MKAKRKFISEMDLVKILRDLRLARLMKKYFLSKTEQYFLRMQKRFILDSASLSENSENE
jgi:hypothetical protein